MTAATRVGPPITRRASSAAAKATRIVEIASHADDAGAAVFSIECADMTSTLWGAPGEPRERNLVTIQTDGRGFLALVEHMELGIGGPDGDGGNVYASGYVGLLDLPVTVFTPRAEAVAAGLVTT